MKYCKNCKYIKLELNDSEWIGFLICKNKDNKKIIKEKDTYFVKGDKYIEYINHPKVINKNNDCKWYKRKWYKFWAEER